MISTFANELNKAYLPKEHYEETLEKIETHAKRPRNESKTNNGESAISLAVVDANDNVLKSKSQSIFLVRGFITFEVLISLCILTF